MNTFLLTTLGVLVCAILPNLALAQSAKSIGQPKTSLSVAAVADEREPKIKKRDLKEDLAEIAQDQRQLARDIKRGNKKRIAKDREKLAADQTDLAQDASPSL
jgi:hypothetical protein